MAQRVPGIARRFGEAGSLSLSQFTDSNGKNILVNGDFSIDLRRGDNSAYTSATTPANSDDTYLLDQWILLSDGNDIVDVNGEPSSSSDIPSGGRFAIKLDVETANKKFGIFQPIEVSNCKQIDSQVVSLSFKVKAGGGSTISNIRAGIVHFTSGTPNTITSDIVSAWEAAGTDPTLIANWSYANTPANVALTTSYQTVKIENITMGTVLNAGVFIWVDDTDAQVGEFVFLADVQLEVGSIATTFDRRAIMTEVALCERYFTKTMNPSVPPADNSDTAGALTDKGRDGGHFAFTWDLRTLMFTNPTIVTFNPSSGTSGEARNTTDSSDEAVTTNLAGSNRVGFDNTAADSSHAGDDMILHATAEAVL